MQALVYNGPGQKKLAGILVAYETFATAAETQALKVIIQA